MKLHSTIAFVFLLITQFVSGQTNADYLTGKISYISSQNIYVKFDNTDGIQIGDTLFSLNVDKKEPILIIENLSSISASGKPITNKSFEVSTPIYGKLHILENPIIDNSKTSISVNDKKIAQSFIKDNSGKKSEAHFDGRLSISSYSNISRSKSNQRFRYNLSLNGDHIANTNFSTETYISFTHKLGDTLSLNNSLKIYSLALKYDFNKTTNLSFGRKINMNMANIGAVDGLQFEKTSKNFTYGLIVGTRPDYMDYGFNPKLLQAGAFVSHKLDTNKGSIQTSAAIFNQTNDFKTDRRFAYIQHSNSLIKHVDLFCSAEIDFYTKVNLQPTNTFDLTSTYISLRYKPVRKLSLSLSYDARKNIYYYETFKNTIDSIIDRETRQGLRFNTIYRPFKNVIWGGTAGYRIQKPDTIPAINANTFLSFTQVPIVDAVFTLNATYLNSKYQKGSVYAASLSRDLFKAKIYTDLSYRYVNYISINNAEPLIQNILELSFSWRIAKKLTLSADFEGTLEKNNNNGRVYINISQRF